MQLTTAAMLMKDHEVFSKVTGGCSLPQLWVGEPLAPVAQQRGEQGGGALPCPPSRTAQAKRAGFPHSEAALEVARPGASASGPRGLHPGGNRRKDFMIRT